MDIEYFEFCRRQARSCDRIHYLAGLLSPREHQAAYFALTAFYGEVTSISHKVSQPLAGELRLQWWRESLCGARAQETSANPLAAALQRLIETHPLTPEAFEPLLSAQALRFYANTPTSPEAELEGFRQRRSAFYSLLAQIIEPTPECGKHKETFACTARICAVVDHIQQLAVSDASHHDHLLETADALQKDYRNFCHLARDVTKPHRRFVLPAVLAPIYLRALKSPRISPALMPSQIQIQWHYTKALFFWP